MLLANDRLALKACKKQLANGATVHVHTVEMHVKVLARRPSCRFDLFLPQRQVVTIEKRCWAREHLDTCVPIACVHAQSWEGLDACHHWAYIEGATTFSLPRRSPLGPGGQDKALYTTRREP